jgi:hypothetical protein
MKFLFLGSTSCCVYYQGYYKCRLSQQLFKICLLIYICYCYMFRPLLAIFRWNIQLIAGSYCIYNGSIVLCALVLLGSIHNIFGKFCSCQFKCMCVCVCVLSDVVLHRDQATTLQDKQGNHFLQEKEKKKGNKQLQGNNKIFKLLQVCSSKVLMLLYLMYEDTNTLFSLHCFITTLC